MGKNNPELVPNSGEGASEIAPSAAVEGVQNTEIASEPTSLETTVPFVPDLEVTADAVDLTTVTPPHVNQNRINPIDGTGALKSRFEQGATTASNVAHNVVVEFTRLREDQK
ncbi:hypothetical protein JXA59_02360 [Patescibacteria group bacterium]|nr:hypothetical protein [Patescibacteria group bacterium]